MNILFITENEISPTRSGVSRVNYALVKELSSKYQVNCYLAYIHSTEQTETSIFVNTIKIDTPTYASQLLGYLKEHHIHYILTSFVAKQSIQQLLPKIKVVANQLHIPIIFWLHNMPGHELVSTNKQVLWYRIVHLNNKLSNLKKLLAAFLSGKIFNALLIKLFLRKKYRLIIDCADKVVVLSNNSIASLARIVGISSSHKFLAIPNSLSFDENDANVQISNKQKKVLIVARIDEDSKRIASALRIWSLIERSTLFNDWHLVIVGTGPDEQYCKLLSTKLNLHNVFFEGWQDSKTYYKEASIFMMTSSNESFSMTLTEAQQMGVVPIAFDSFGAVHDIIKHEFNGLIIPNNNIKKYAEQLTWLMQHDQERLLMASNAVKSSKQFQPSKVGKLWVNLFEAL